MNIISEYKCTQNDEYSYEECERIEQNIEQIIEKMENKWDMQ